MSSSTARRARNLLTVRPLLLAAVLLLVPGSSSAAPAAKVIASGTFRLPAAQAFGEPGFHQVLVASGRLPHGLRLRPGARIVVSLRDAGRPGRQCSSEHPLSGCATVDWSDDPRRPKVPPGGVFENSLTLGRAKLFLRESRALALRPDRYTPG